MSVREAVSCRACGQEIRLTEAGWGHVEPYRVGTLHPRHRAVPVPYGRPETMGRGVSRDAAVEGMA